MVGQRPLIGSTRLGKVSHPQADVAEVGPGGVGVLVLGSFGRERLERLPGGGKVAEHVSGLADAIPRGRRSGMVGAGPQELLKPGARLGVLTLKEPGVGQAEKGVRGVKAGLGVLQEPLVFLRRQLITPFPEKAVGEVERLGHLPRRRGRGLIRVRAAVDRQSGQSQDEDRDQSQGAGRSEGQGHGSVSLDVVARPRRIVPPRKNGPGVPSGLGEDELLATAPSARLLPTVITAPAPPLKAGRRDDPKVSTAPNPSSIPLDTPTHGLMVRQAVLTKQTRAQPG